MRQSSWSFRPVRRPWRFLPICSPRWCLVLSEAELDPFFESAQREIFRLEVLADYAVDVESRRFRDYVAGAEYEPTEWFEFIGSKVAAGTTFRKVTCCGAR